jgi:hypothetical protein
MDREENAQRQTAKQVVRNPSVEELEASFLHGKAPERLLEMERQGQTAQNNGRL